MKTRRTFLKETSAALLAGSTLHAERARRAGTPAPPSRAALRDRKRRLLWNNDGSDMLQPAFAGAKFPIPVESVEQFLGNTLRFVEGTKVDTILYCAHVNQPEWEFPRKYIEALGPNPVKPVVDFARGNGMEFFYSIRMNDVHCSFYAPKASYWPPFKLKHPELLIGYISAQHWEEEVVPWIRRFMAIEEERWQRGLYDPEKERALLRQAQQEHPLADVIRRYGPPSWDLWFWAGYDYALPQVRARYLEVIRGACERYDLDGIELDWARHYGFFKPGQTRRNIPIMNDFVQQVRQVLDYYGEKRGRPILLASGRTPDSLERSLSLGLDVETWAREGWIDLINAGSGAMPFSIPIREWVELGERWGIPVYGSLDRIYHPFQTGQPKWDVRDPGMSGEIASDYEAVHAASHRFWEGGVRGICLYDWHTHHGPTQPEEYGILPAIEEPGALARRTKVYRLDPGYERIGCLVEGCLPGQMPRAFSTQSGPIRARFPLEVSGDPRTASEVTVQVQYAPAGGSEDLPVTASSDHERGQVVGAGRFRWQVNGVLLSEPRRWAKKRYGGYGRGWIDDEGGVEFKTAPRNLKQGLNTLELTVLPPENGDGGEVVQVTDVRIRLSKV